MRSLRANEANRQNASAPAAIVTHKTPEAHKQMQTCGATNRPAIWDVWHSSQLIITGQYVGHFATQNCCSHHLILINLLLIFLFSRASMQRLHSLDYISESRAMVCCAVVFFLFLIFGRPLDLFIHFFAFALLRSRTWAASDHKQEREKETKSSRKIFNVRIIACDVWWRCITLYGEPVLTSCELRYSFTWY